MLNPYATKTVPIPVACCGRIAETTWIRRIQWKRIREALALFGAALRMDDGREAHRVLETDCVRLPTRERAFWIEVTPCGDVSIVEGASVDPAFNPEAE